MNPSESPDVLFAFPPEKYVDAVASLPADNPWKLAAAVVEPYAVYRRQQRAFKDAVSQGDEAAAREVLASGFDLCASHAYAELDGVFASVLRNMNYIAPRKEKSPDFLQLLIDAGVDINQPWPVDGETPLMYAARFGMGTALPALLARGAKPEGRMGRGNTTLHLAVIAEPPTGMPHEDMTPEEVEQVTRKLLERYAENIRALVAAGADVNAVNDAGETPLVLAVKRREALLISTLCELGGDVSWRDTAGNTLLHLLVQNPPTLWKYPEEAWREEAEQSNRRVTAHYLDAVRVLLAAGVDPNAANAAGETPLSLAEKNGHAELVKLLREHEEKDK